MTNNNVNHGEEGKEKGVFRRAKGKYAAAIAAVALSAAAGCGRTELLVEPSCSCDSGVCQTQSDAGQAKDAGSLDSGPSNDAGTKNDAGTNSDAGADGGVPQPVVLWQGSNLIGDYLNRTLDDRGPNSSPSDISAAYPIGGSDTDQNANPFTDGKGGSIGPSDVFMYKIDGSQVNEFA